MAKTDRDPIRPAGVPAARTPVDLPPAAPVAVRAAAVACALAIDDMVEATKAGNGEAVVAADGVVTAHRNVIEAAGWRLAGIMPLDSGERGWKLVAARGAR